MTRILRLELVPEEDEEDYCFCCGEPIGIGASSGGAYCHACSDAGCSAYEKLCEDDDA